MRVWAEVQEVLRKGVVSDTAATRPDADAATPWYRDGLCFACTQCGNCCSGAPGFVWVTPEECERIAGVLRIPVETFIAQHTRRTASGRRSLLEHRNGDCEFLERVPGGKTRCTIHAARPTQCRTWPFWKSNLESAETWADTGRHCPGINQGTRHPLPVIQQALADNGSRPL